ncbi:hypothetical protein FOZ63_033373 [Perkinsus olseni]|uniref:Uncharacterized protein n=2 Tax=Perkinsus olseni TaxID=32597 RepID=A0A7J6NNM6_PEROL|nr:hypothetical protein FOZ60_006545 [Perkinsus olseni]KAF4698518.1 hypothetical protein FOZ63_033373 [Perkinsus olseni]
MIIIPLKFASLLLLFGTSTAIGVHHKAIKKLITKGQSHRWNPFSLAIYPDDSDPSGCYVKSKFYGQKHYIYFKLKENDNSGGLVYTIAKEKSDCPLDMSPINVEAHVTTGNGDVNDCRKGVRRISATIGMKDGLNPLHYVKRSHNFIKRLCEKGPHSYDLEEGEDNIEYD